MLSPGAHRHRHANKRRRKHRGRHRAHARSAVHLSRLILATSLAGGAAIFTTSGLTAPADPPQKLNDLSVGLEDRALAEQELTRSLERNQTPSPSASPSPTLTGPPPPVAGLTEAQMNNAWIIVQVGRQMGLPDRALIIAIATALQESGLYNNASEAVPESLKYPHEGTSVDHDSVGVFQQRPSMGWGSVADLMKPAYQAGKFFAKLVKLDYMNMSVASAAQAVQVSAFPSAYAKHESRATQIVDAF